LPHLAAQRAEPTSSQERDTSTATTADSEPEPETSTETATITKTTTVTATSPTPESSPPLTPGPPSTPSPSQTPDQTDQSQSSIGEQAQPAELAAGVTDVAQPRRPQAAASDVELARQAQPIAIDPSPAPPAEINRLRHLVIPQQGADADLKVMQWQPEWVQYDHDFRPVILNAFPDLLTVIYDDGGQPRSLVIPPLGQAVIAVPELGSHSFTALRTNVLGLFIDVAVGNFFGGGYAPPPGVPPPPDPRPVRALTAVPVQMKYATTESQPIVVRTLVDVGADPTLGGAHKVLLDGATPAWGEWKHNDDGVAQFEIHKTQRLPGLEAPAEGPLPGYPDIRLVNTAIPTGHHGGSAPAVVAAAAGVAVGAIGTALILTTRRRPQH
jgi:hypothetical protein